MKIRHTFPLHLCSILFFVYVCAFSCAVQAAFCVHKVSSAASVRASMQPAVPSPTFETVKELFAGKHTKSASGFLAYCSAGCGLFGILIASIHTVFLILLLGLIAGVTGKMGLKRYKRKPFLRALCYAGIILGAILVLFGTIPILFLI